MRRQLGDERVNEMLRRFREQDQDQDEKKDDTKKDDRRWEWGWARPSPRSRKERPTSYKNYAPDKKKYVYAFKYNLYLCEEGQPEEKAAQLSTDGVEDYVFAGGFGGGFGGRGKGSAREPKRATPPTDRKTRAERHLVDRLEGVLRHPHRQPRREGPVPRRLHRQPAAEARAVQVPDARRGRRSASPNSTSATSRRRRSPRSTPKWKDERYSDLRWGKSPGELRFIRRDRLQRNLEVCSFDVFTGTCKCLFGEAFDAAYLDMQAAALPRGERRDDLVVGAHRLGPLLPLRPRRHVQERRSRRGAWRASRIVEVDAKNGFVYLVGNGREPGENPYYTHLYRVKLDGTELTCLDPSDRAGRRRHDRPAGSTRSSSLSPTQEVRRRQQHAGRSRAVRHRPRRLRQAGDGAGSRPTCPRSRRPAGRCPRRSPSRPPTA